MTLDPAISGSSERVVYMEIRLQKYFSDCGVLSRRTAEKEIEAGHVTVNGSVAVMGQKINPDTDEVRWNHRPIRMPLTNGTRKYTYILLHKPVGYVTTLSDDRGRPTIAELLHGIPGRVYPVGRLDMYSDGLLLCTDDGELTNLLTHPSHEVPKVYLATLCGKLTGSEIRKLGESIELDGRTTRPVETKRIAECTFRGNPATVVEFTLYEGRNRQIRRMCEAHDKKIYALTRIRMGDIELGTLPCGKWRYLTDEEVASLREKAQH